LDVIVQLHIPPKPQNPAKHLMLKVLKNDKELERYPKGSFLEASQEETHRESRKP